jgi:iron complex outermembrane recepter protein
MQYRNIVYDFEGLGVVNEETVPLDQTAVFHFLNPKTGFLFDINSSNNVYLFFGISNREPVRDDFTESSAESRPRHETLRNLELGYRFRNKDFQAGINYYLMSYKDQLILTGEINDVGGFTRTNIDKSYRMGLELESSLRINQWVELAGNVTFSRNKIPEFTEFSDVYDGDWNWIGTDVKTYENTNIAFSPSVVSAGMLNLHPVKNGKISFQSKYVSNQYIDNTMSSDRMLDPYLVNDLKMSYVIRKGIFSELELSLAIYNIFDEKYITNAWIYKGILGDSELTTLEDGYFPQAGRHFLAGLRLKL